MCILITIRIHHATHLTITNTMQNLIFFWTNITDYFVKSLPFFLRISLRNKLKRLYLSLFPFLSLKKTAEYSISVHFLIFKGIESQISHCRT